MGRWILAMLAVLCLAHGTAQAQAVRVTLLGTGMPVPSSDQFGASTLVETGGRAFLFDCGRGCSIRLMQTRPELLNRVDRVFLTHLHSDHLVGLPDLWMNGWLQRRATNFRVWGPPGTQGFMDGLRQAFAWDIDNRNRVERVPASTTGLDYVVTEIASPGVVYDADGVRIIAFVADHGEARPALSYRLESQGKVVVFSGDTRMTPELVRQSRGVDILVQEVVPPSLISYLRENYTAEQADKVIAHHTTVSEIGELVGKNAPRLLVYSHFTRGVKSDQQLIQQTRAVWHGPFVLGEDLMSFEIGDTIKLCKPAAKCRQVVPGK